jgi:flagellar motility protein MotE (MotC chaperone)
MRLLRDLRLIPVVAIAAAALFVLKTSGILIEGGYTLIASRTAQAQGLAGSAPAVNLPPPAPLEDANAPRGGRTSANVNNPSVNNPNANNPNVNSWVRDLYTPPSTQSQSEDVTGSVAAPPKLAEPSNDAAPANGAAPADKTAAPAPLDAPKPSMSAGERAVLESLQQRRQELETRAREIEVRDSLLKAAERRIELRLQELKELETRLTGAHAKKDEADAAKFKSLVTMYENMKAKDAAKIFDRLDLRILVEVADAMNPRRMSDILGLMMPEAAERLTVELATRSGQIGKNTQPAELPKIDGRPKS